MKIKNINVVLLFLFFSFFIVSCSSEATTEEKTKNVANAEGIENAKGEVVEEETIEKTVICLWQKLSVREEATKKSKVLTYIHLGESGTFSGEIVSDQSSAKKKEYLKIKLKDGVQGWVESRFVAIDAVPFAVTEKTKLYKRPDVLTATQKTLDKMQYVVVLTDQDQWLEIKAKINGESWFSEGWVKASKLSKRDIDVTVAILSKRAFSLKNDEKKKDALNEILSNSDFNGSVFIPYLEKYLIDMKNEEAVYADSLSNMAN